MSNADAVAQLYLDSFGNSRLGVATAVSLATTANAVATIPLVVGGLTNSGNVTSSGSVIVRRVTISNPSASSNNAYVTITTSSDANASNAIVSSVVLANITAAGRYQDLTIAQPYLSNTAVSGATTSALYVNVTQGNGTATVTVSVYGDVVSF